MGEAFRELQLRVRDGELTEDDYKFMKEHMMLEGREREFQGPRTYKFVTTHEARNARNTEAFEAALEDGTPSITIPALNSGPTAAAADEEDMGHLPNELHLCLGARVLITRNLCVYHGLCNGTIGIVHDIIVNSKGFVEAVVLKVRRATPPQDGYKGPSFCDGAKGVDPSTEVLVAINRRSSEIYDAASKKDEQREQFPLMLAWALTIHKAQGLTLERVVIDAGDDERSVGLLFVAMTRVRHPSHIAFSPWPGIDRVTSVIARKPALRKRKQHETQLRGLANETATRLGLPPLVQPSLRLNPVNAQSRQPAIRPPSHRSTPPIGNQLPPWKKRSSPRSSTPTTNQGLTRQPQQKRPKQPSPQLLPSQGPSCGQKRARPTTDQQTERARLQRQREYDKNGAAVAALNLPRLVTRARSRLQPAPELPWLLELARADGLEMKARVVDFWSGSQGTRTAIASWLRDLGFDVTVTADRAQIGQACGYVAARVIGLMYAAGNAWRSIDVSDAVDAVWIQRGNASLENGKTTDVNLETQEVHMLASRFHDVHAEWDHEQQAFPTLAWPLNIGSLDWVELQVATVLMDFADGYRGARPKRAFFVTNTQDCRADGAHWISIAISMQWLNPNTGLPAWPSGEMDEGG